MSWEELVRDLLLDGDLIARITRIWTILTVYALADGH
jgi:hypothetical protein